MADCEMLVQCRAKALEDAKFDGGTSARLTNIEASVTTAWQKIEDVNKTILGLTWKLGLISGGTAFVTSLIIGIVAAVIKK